MNEYSKYRANRMLRAAFVLLLLVLVSARTVAGTYARYVTDAVTGGTAWVAKFEISVSQPWASQELALTLDPEMTTPQTYPMAVCNVGETSLRVTVKLMLRGNLPLAVSAQDAENTVLRTVDNTLTVQDADTLLTTVSWDFELAPGAQCADSLLIGWTGEDAYQAYRYENGVEYAWLTVSAEQID